ncbi:hypothetical protein [Dysgonomonas massiliensis]|uniref:hypothetical protein n=1 Tax=Dysgonomonas massiliensis TaxID=2040292 RepID=UPI0011AF072F|nr:hypothetical protein [Dysgonomonas massiliensis]
MPKTRPADYYLGCLDGSVFLDFNDTNDFVSLIRISFDGYGCCNLGSDSVPLNENDSSLLKKMMQNGTIDQDILEEIVRKAISLNKSLIWEDALEEYFS